MIYTYDTYETADVYAFIPELVVSIIWESRSTQECAFYRVPRRVSGRQLEREANKYTFVPFQAASEMLEKIGLPMKDQVEEDPSVARWGWLRMNDRRDREPFEGCGKRIGYEQGIPLWKMFNFNFWPGTDHPVRTRGRGHRATIPPRRFLADPPPLLSMTSVGQRMDLVSRTLRRISGRRPGPTQQFLPGLFIGIGLYGCTHADPGGQNRSRVHLYQTPAEYS